MTFLETVAQDIIKKYGTDLSHIVMVFPNKRASLFMNDYIAAAAGKPVWAPTYKTISELFREQSTLMVPNDIKLVCDLYKTFCEVTGSTEPLDRFYGYGQQMLADFDDIDKSMADARQVFHNVSSLHEFDSIDYLTEEQRAILKRSFGNFNDNLNSRLKERFVKLWNRLFDVYTLYKERLRSQGLAYEGMLYRDVVCNDVGAYPCGRPIETAGYTPTGIIFVGFNLLQKTEQELFSYYKHSADAHFYWDYDHYYTDEDNEAGKNIKRYLEQFPNGLPADSGIYDCLGRQKRIAYIGAPTEDIQARYVSQWLKEEGRAKDGRQTAIVMCNEALLPTIIHCIPPEAGEVNITTGYPLYLSPLCTLIDSLISLQAEKAHRSRIVRHINRHPYAKLLPEGTTNAVCGRPQGGRPQGYAPTVPANIRVSDNEAILAYIMDTIKAMAPAVPDTDIQLTEALYKLYTIVNMLHQLVSAGDLDVDTSTLQRLLSRITQTGTIPLSGEPAVGVQVMGVLETRNLDFDHVLLLSCNEGNMPRAVNDSSLIPHSIRKVFGLTTSDSKVAVYSYYFHRLIARAKDVTMVYNTSTSDAGTREMSRFMMQLMVESNHNIERYTLSTDGTVGSNITSETTIKKDDNIIHILHERICAEGKFISPSAINKYMECPLQFYFNYVAGLREPDNKDEEEIDYRMFGSIFHKAAELMYRDSMPESGIEQAVDNAFKIVLYGHEDDYKDFELPDLNGVQLIMRGAIVNYVRKLMEIDKQPGALTVTGMEKWAFCHIDVATAAGNVQVKVGGIIDRLDEVSDSQGGRIIRVVDYKTGSEFDNDVKDIDAIFTAIDPNSKHTDYYLQAMLYAVIVSEDKTLNPLGLPVSPALLFIQKAGAEGYDPTLQLNKQKITDIREYADEFRTRLSAVIAEILDSNVPFKATECEDTCGRCAYKRLCQGR